MDGPTSTATPTRVSFAEAWRYWFRLGFLNFGGPAGQIAMMHGDLVEGRRWVSEERFLRALNYCILLPGPEAQQLAIYLGWLLHGVRGGIWAGLLFILPAFFLMLGISAVLVLWGTQPLLAGIFYGLQVAVVAIVFAALWRLGQRVLRHPVFWLLAAWGGGAMSWGVALPVILALAAAVGGGAARVWPQVLSEEASIGPETPAHPPQPGHAWRVGLAGGVLWGVPMLAVWLWLGAGHVLWELGLFFSKVAWVTFGGAYAVLPYVAREAVETHAWLSAGDMLSGLALAESTPGPLIMVVQVVGFFGAWAEPGPLAPWCAAVLGAVLTLWVTFLPGFLLVLGGAPYAECWQGWRGRGVRAAMGGVSASVVGLIAYLGVWLGLQVFVEPSGEPDGFALVLAGIFFLLMRRRGMGVLPVVLIGGVLGCLWQMFA